MACASKKAWLPLLAFLSVSVGCGSNGLKGGAGGTAGAVEPATGGIGAGGSSSSVATGGTGTDGGATGGVATGGMGTGNSVTGGIIGTGGAASGGMGSGGRTTGGAGGGPGTGGTGAGGLAAGGSQSGGIDGGASTGGSGSGGLGSGGTVGTGGNAAGGAVGTGGKGAGGVVGTGGNTVGGAVGTGGAYLDVNSHTMELGSLAVGSTSAGTVTVINQGGSISGVPTIRIEGDDAASVTAAGCNAALPPGASCVLTIHATAPSLGLFQAYVRIIANPGTETMYQSYLSITVVGNGAGFQLSSPASVDLGQVAPDVVLKQVITVSALIALTDLKVWTYGDGVSVDTAGTTCTATLAAGASCVVTVQFVSASIGWKRGTVGVKAGGDYGQVASVEFTANVSKANDLAIDPKTPQSFVGFFEKTSPPVVFTVTNLASTTSGAISPTIAGPDARDFKVASTSCTTLAPQATCTVSVVCAPQMSESSATRHAVLSVTDGNTQLSIPLSAEVNF